MLLGLVCQANDVLSASVAFRFDRLEFCGVLALKTSIRRKQSIGWKAEVVFSMRRNVPALQGLLASLLTHAALLRQSWLPHNTLVFDWSWIRGEGRIDTHDFTEV